MIRRALRALAPLPAIVPAIAAAACAPPEHDAEAGRRTLDVVRSSLPDVAALLEDASRGTIEPARGEGGWRLVPGALSDDEPAGVSPSEGGAAAPGWTSSSGVLSVELGATSADAALITASGRRSAAIRYRDAAGAPGLAPKGTVLFSHVAPGAHAVWIPRERDVEELLLVESQDAEVVYDFELPPGSALHHPIPEIVELREGRRSWLRMRFDSAWSEGPDTPRIQVFVEGSTVRVRAESDAWPVVIDPIWQTTTEMAYGRYLHTVTLLDSGEVLVAGGRADDYHDTAELFSANLGEESSFTMLEKMTEARASHTATLLPDGRVLLTGSDRSGPYSGTAELFDPDTLEFTATASPMSVGRAHHTATLLKSGEVLLLGGAADSQAELYSPGIDAFSSISAPAFPGRHYHTATRLQDGKVLIVGGEAGTELEIALVTAEVFDPKTQTFSTLEQPSAEGRLYHAATLLPSGGVLLTGGRPSELGPNLTSAEIYHPATGFQPLASLMSTGRSIHISELLPEGRVLLAGGSTFPSCDVFTPGDDPFTGVLSRTADLPFAHNQTAGSRIGQGRVFIVGTGIDTGHKAGAIFVPGTLGLSCGSSDECENGFCVDGVCCESACQQTCHACSRAAKGYGENGACEPVRAGADPHFDCLVGKVEGSASCPNNGFCDDRGGKCEFPCGDDDGRACRPPDRCESDRCASAVDCLSGYRCNASGVCEPIRADDEARAPAPICAAVPAPFDCGGAGLRWTALLVFAARLSLLRRRRRTRARPPGSLIRGDLALLPPPT